MVLLRFKALSDATRLRLMHILLHYELSVNELVTILGMGQSRISRHLKILTEAGLLLSRRDGLCVFYSASAQGVGHDFLQAVMPFVHPDTVMMADAAAAERMLEDRASKTRQFFNSIAENWDELNSEILGPFDLPGAVCERVPASCGTAADLGCGTGTVLARLFSQCEKVIGVDGSARMLDLCRRRFREESIAEDRLSLRIGELAHLPLCDREADFACINLVLHHLSDPLVVLRETRRILSRQGALVVADFLQHDDETMRTRYGDLWLGFPRETLAAWLDEAGFVLRKTDSRSVGRGLTLLLMTATVA